MTNKELQELLKQYPDEMPVYADHEADEIEIRDYGCSSVERYIYIRGVWSDPQKAPTA